jgi:hypothetical protein
MMSRVITFDKGSKRRMNQIRWEFHQVLGAVLISLVILGLCALLEIWEVSRYSEPPKSPQVKAGR